LIIGNTNRQNFELFAAVADGPCGIGVPLAYIFISMSKDAIPGSKQQILSSWLTSLKSLGINPEFVLTDKDQSEINAVKHVWPNAKHQLCFWHSLRAVKKRLSQTKSTPAYYDAEKAAEYFDFIDKKFLPRKQCPAGEKQVLGDILI
jgi:hypothetical protein